MYLVVRFMAKFYGQSGRASFLWDCCINHLQSEIMAVKGSPMSSEQPFKRHRFPAAVILCAVRTYLRYPLSYQDVTDLLSERGLDVDRSTVFRWVQKFGPELSKRTERHLSPRALIGMWMGLISVLVANGVICGVRSMPTGSW